MAYDKNLDKQLFSETKEFDTTRITVSIMQYNEGDKKIQISREDRTQEGEWRFAKLGRLFKEEAEALVPMLQKAVENLD
ncbi:hypothetical protein D6745_03250 [Candidatus Woesearchaeota archaeon]|nr:MAG: hypothetical protein D6745_03250 [Candidatus Woesearchaeota archaeon]